MTPSLLAALAGGLAVLLLVCLVAYATGRRRGIAAGRGAALAEAPVDLRCRALESGCCPVCGTRFPAADTGDAPPDGLGSETCYNPGAR